MKRIVFLLLFFSLLSGCKTLNKEELLGEETKCNNKICNNKNYLFDVHTVYNHKNNWSVFPALLSLGTLQLLGFPYFEEGNTDVVVTLRTKTGTLIKTYKAEGPVKSNVAAILYGYSITGAETASRIESLGDALRSIQEQINADKTVYAEAEKIRKKEEHEIDELKKIFNGHSFYKIDSFLPTSISEIASTLNIGDIVYFFPGQRYGFDEMGLFAGQNTYDGNLADYKTVLNFDKTFLYGQNSYIDGQPIGGYYRYVGGYSYTTVLGAGRTVPAFRAVDIPERLKKYIGKI